MESLREIFRIGHGPSSSHTMGPGKAAKLFNEKYIDASEFKVILYGSLAATGKGHFTDKVIEKTISPKVVEIIWNPEEFLPKHPNGMKFIALDNKGYELGSEVIYSIGGGAIVSEENWDKKMFDIYSEKTMDDILSWQKKTGGSLWEYVVKVEGEEVFAYLREVWNVMKASIEKGLDSEGLLPGTLGLQRKASAYLMKANNAVSILKNIGLISSYALAVSEENACGGLVVTAPTCGAAGVLPAVLYFLEKIYNISEQKLLRGLATAGLIGNLVKRNASISGAEVGCQGEIGTACAMAAGAAAQLLGGTVKQIEYAAEMGIEHHLGLTCDPVEGYVQIPCIERNAIAAGRAIQCASYAILSDGGHRISFDEVVLTMKETGLDMGNCYKETSKCGLAKNWLNSELKTEC